MTFSLRRLSLLWRILLSTSIALTLLFALTGWVVETYASRVGVQNLEEEVRTSLQSYEAIWTDRANTLAAISRIISSMSDVRAAFQTGDQATIRDTAQELWSRASQDDAVFLVIDPTGNVIASLSGASSSISTGSWLRGIVKRFPSQVSGFLPQGERLFYVVLTPVYVQSGEDQALLNVLLAGFEVNDKFVNGLKRTTRGSDFSFFCANRLVASTLSQDAANTLNRASNHETGTRRASLRGAEYLVLDAPVTDVGGVQIGVLQIVRSFEAASRAVVELQRNVVIIWVIAVLAGLAFTFLMANRIVGPVKRLDRAASEVANRNYDFRVPVESDDELGRLARTFNAMCESISKAREDLIRQERIATIGRMSSSLVHDLRNPLAAIYGGAEMLMDGDLPASQSQRLATSIYRASRRMQELLQDLVNISRGKTESVESCNLIEIVDAAREMIAPAADSQNVAIFLDIPEDIELPLERGRMQRVFLNLFHNALEAMPKGGELRVTARREAGAVLVEVDDTGAGIAEQVRSSLFQPFASFGKKNGLGLGLALARQTVVDNGGDLWIQNKPTPGARFCIHLSETRSS